MFHLAGVPTYIVLAELAGHRVLHGDLPRPAYPPALRRGRGGRRGRPTPWPPWTTPGARTRPAATWPTRPGRSPSPPARRAHAVLAARGEWVTNDKTLLDRAGLRGVDEILAGLTAEPQELAGAVARATDLVSAPGIRGPGR